MRAAPLVPIVIALAAGVSCHGIQSNPAPTRPSTTLVPNQIVLTVGPPELPVTGGTATVDVAVSCGGYAGVGGVRVTLSATAGELRGEAPVVVRRETPPPPPPPPPPSDPTPGPTPPTTPGPVPTPPPPPGPAGDLVLAINISPAAPNAAAPVTLSAALSSSTGAAIPRMDWFAWDTNGDLANDQVGAVPSPVVSYAAGAYTIYLTVITLDNREVRATRAVVVDAAPVLTATLTPSTTTPDLATPVTFTANVVATGPTGAVTSYAWDFDGDGAVDQTTAVNTATMAAPYTTVGAKTARLTVTSANGQTGTATSALTVTAPALVVGLGVAPAAPQPAGTTLTLTATVTSTGAIPASMAFAWDYTNDGTVDEVTTGGSPRSVDHVYNTTGTKTVRVTVTSPDGRTATNTLTITVS
jgi:PKD repeat protein